MKSDLGCESKSKARTVTEPNFFQRCLPEHESEARARMYQGAVYLLEPNAASLQLVERLLDAIRSVLGDGYRQFQFEADDATYFERIGELRKRIYTNPEYHRLVESVIDEVGFSLCNQAYDPARLRVIAHLGHQHEAAKAIYYGHRDTWYGNAQSMITWWVPLHDIDVSESFEFYPDAFSVAVENDSEVFDFDDWVSGGQQRRIGWQDKSTGLLERYPRLLETPPARSVPVVAKHGEILLFSGQHLHQTRENATGRMRFSCDFRTVDVPDHRSGREAVNVDNRSTGLSLKQFCQGEGFLHGGLG